MSKGLLTVSLSPHLYSGQSVKGIMWNVNLALLPALLWGIYAFGLGALIVTLISVVACVLFEYLIQKFVLKVPTRVSDGSAVVTGLLLAFNLPANLPWWIVVIGAMVAIGVAKMTFGGLGNNPFNPALVGRVFLLVSFPVQMTNWPQPFVDRMALDGVTAATPLAIVKEGVRNGQRVAGLFAQLPSYGDMFIGKMGGCIGEVSAAALLLGFVFLLWRKIITWHIPVAMIGTVAVFSGILWVSDPQKYVDPLFHVLAGGVMLGAIFMATDMVTSPMTPKGMLIFGAMIGFLTVIIRVFGAYPEGVSFAILIMNAVVPLINRLCKPYRFGEGKGNG